MSIQVFDGRQSQRHINPKVQDQAKVCEDPCFRGIPRKRVSTHHGLPIRVQRRVHLGLPIRVQLRAHHGLPIRVQRGVHHDRTTVYSWHPIGRRPRVQERWLRQEPRWRLYSADVQVIVEVIYCLTYSASVLFHLI